MDEQDTLRIRREKLRQLKNRSHMRIVPKDISGNRFLNEEIDEKVIAFSDISQEYSERILNIDVSISKEEFSAFLKNFDNETDPIDPILEPVFLSLFDGTMRAFKIGTKQGITASRLYNECKSFSYVNPANHNSMLDSYTEHLNERDNISDYGNTATYANGKISRDGDITNMRDGYKMGKAKEKHFNGERTASDGYGGNKEIYESGTHAKGVDKKSQRTEIDHAVACAEICNNLKKNKALTDSDIKDIINNNENLVATSFENNRGAEIGKFDKSQSELQKEIKQGYISDSKGNKIRDLSKKELEVRSNMVAKMGDAQKAMDNKTNQTVINNLFESDKNFKERIKQEHSDQIPKAGKKISEEELNKDIDKKLKDRKNLRTRMSKDALNGAAHQSLGEIILLMIKPLYYELKDCFINGIEEGVCANSFKSALFIRINRIKKFVLEQAGSTLKDNIFSFFKNFLSMLLEGIVNCFVGVFKHVMRMIKEGFKMLMQIVPILRDKNRTINEKGDAILKLAVSSLTIFASIGIESWLNSLGIGEPWSIIISSVLTATITALTMYLIDKMDIFGIKEEVRLKRIDEILSLRVEETKENMFSMVSAII